MKRRIFVKKSSMTVMSISAFGAINWNGKNYVGSTPTTTDILGPFYRPGSPMRSNIIHPGSTGTPMGLKGTIYGDDGTTPLSDALVEIWQCDEKEHYDNSSDDYAFRGAVQTSANGKYEFKTIVPVPYQANPETNSWRPAHIHMRVSVPGQQDLITQIYFKGDKYLEQDSSSSAPDAVNRILNISKNRSGESEVVFDVVMSKQFPLEQAVYDRITGLYQTESGNNVEFVQRDDMLFVKRNGQYHQAITYKGNNTFEGARGFPKVIFELLPNGIVKVNYTYPGGTYTGEKFLKYKE
ncbi:MAG: catechol 1,2-dioxygenase [Bacteroidota bacterium]